MKEIIDFIKKTISAFPKWLKFVVVVTLSVFVGFMTFGIFNSCEMDYENKGTKIHILPNSSENQLKKLPSYSAVVSCKTYSEVESLLQSYGFDSPEDFEVYLRENNYVSVADDFHAFIKYL